MWGLGRGRPIPHGLIGRCTGDVPSTSDATESTQLAGTVTRNTYVQAVGLNCRASPAAGAPRIERVAGGARVEVVQEQSGWSELSRLTNCWVSSQYLGPSPPPVRSTTRSSTPRVLISERRSSAPSYFANCSAARAAGAAPVMRGEPGYSRRLDRDGDGVGCE